MLDSPGVHLFDQHLYGYIDIEVLHLANKYQLFQTLIETPQRSSNELAQQLSLDVDVLDRLMTLLAAKSILIKSDTKWSVSPEYSHWLNQKGSQYIGHFIQFIRNEGQQVLQQLEAMLVGKKVSESPYQRLYTDEFKEQTNFAQAMWELTSSSVEILARYLPKNPGRVVDLGGGSGALAFGWLQAATQAGQSIPSVTVFDLPGVESSFMEQQARYHFPENLQFQPGDFFNDSLPDAETYVLSYVMSNWDDDTCARLLATICEQMPDDGQLLILDRLFAADGVHPAGTAIMHLNMKLHTEGRHRSEDEFRQLLSRAGFSRTDITFTETDKQVIRASK